MSKRLVLTGFTVAFLITQAAGGLGLAAPPAPASEAPAELPFGSGAGQAGFANASCEGFSEVYPMGPTSLRGLGTGETALLDPHGSKLLFVGGAGASGNPGANVTELSLKKLHPEMFLADFAPAGPDAFVFADQLRGEIFVAGIDRAKGDARILRNYANQGTAEGCLYQPQLVECSNGRVAVGDFMRSRLLFFDGDLKFLSEVPWDLAGLCLTPEGDFATLDCDEGTYAVLIYSAKDQTMTRGATLDTAGRRAGVLRGMLADGRIVASFLGRRAPREGGRGAWDVCVFSPRGGRQAGVEMPASMPDFREMSTRGDAILHLDYDAELAPKGTVRVVSAGFPR